MADLNGDGKQDIVTANRGDNTLSIFLGNGDGTFQTATSLVTGANPVAVWKQDAHATKANAALTGLRLLPRRAAGTAHS